MKTTTCMGLSALLIGLAPAAFAQTNAPDTAPPANAAPATNAPVTTPAPADAAVAPATAPLNGTNVTAIMTNGEKGLRLNFRGVPLEMVLNYLSDAAGFIIVLETEVRGKIDVWSNEPLTKDEAVDVLNSVLAKNGYAAIRSGRTLKIVSRDDAKTRDLPVKSGADPDTIKKSDEMVIQVVPVRYANAAQLIQNLQPLLPTYAQMTANESGNALVLTATETDVRRMVEIVKALDTSISSVSGIRVFPLNYADAKELAASVKELFAPPTQNQGSTRQQFINRMFGGGGGPPGFGGNAGGGGGSRGGGSASGLNTRVNAVADEASNSLIVSAPDDIIPEIEKLVKEVDVPTSDVTELRVFHLQNADPVELSQIFSELFPDETRTSGSQGQQGFRFGGFGFRGLGGGGGAQGANSGTTAREKKKGRVAAVPDPRTQSIIVSAAQELMPQIAQMIEQLDSSSAKKQKVFVYSLENADVQRVEQVLQDMFQRSTTANRNNNQNSALMNRSTVNNQQNANNSSSGIRNSGIGNSGAGTGQAFR